MAVRREVDLFLGEVSDVLTEIPVLLQNVHVDVERALLSAKWLLRDVLLIEELLPPPYGEELASAISSVLAEVQEEVGK